MMSYVDKNPVSMSVVVRENKSMKHKRETSVKHKSKQNISCVSAIYFLSITMSVVCDLFSGIRTSVFS